MQAPVEIGEVVGDKYRVERVLGVGGMGVVVQARHVELGHLVALKFLTPESGVPDALARFRNEARVLAKMRSEHVTRILDIGTLESGASYIVMEFLDGHDLSEELRQREQLPVEDAVDYVLQAIEALAEAHALGIVHRDLKPGNLFLAKRLDGSTVIKVVDFGVAKILERANGEDLALTRARMLVGSPGFMAPEQMLSAATVDARADIWSLGVILYRMLAGTLPFNASTLVELRAALTTQTPICVSKLNPDVPQPLAQAILRCLEKQPDERFPALDELARAIAPFGRPESAVHVERATRVLAVQQNLHEEVSQEALMPVSSSRQATCNALSGNGYSVLSKAEPTIQRTMPLARTANGWANTEAATVQGSKRRWAFAGLALAAVCFFGTVLWKFWPGANLERAPAGASFAASLPTEATEPAVVAAPKPSALGSAAPKAPKTASPVTAKRPRRKAVVRRNPRPRTKASLKVSDFGGRH